MLWSACSTFIPSEYKEKIHLLNTNSDFSSLHEHVDSFLLPNEYGGQSPIQIQKPIECNVSLIDVPNNAQLDWVCIPAGKSVVQTYYLMQGQKLQSYLRNSQEFNLNSLTNPQKEMEELDEVFAGCERPGLPTLDAWSWTSHKNGFYHVIFGNEKAWLMSVSLEFQLFQLHPNGSKIKINPIPV
ncbi:hypothetical protein M3Y97_00531200 [Aphelenchoides bicaudatus]|nr:hypothetical protein M3Y97_00531200 [Aphelenchoides bicaudatus]